MACPYCRSRKVAEEYTIQTYDLPDEFVAINHVECGKCHAYYTKTIRENYRTDKRRTIITKGSFLTDSVSRNVKTKSRWAGFKQLFNFRNRRRE